MRRRLTLTMAVVALTVLGLLIATRGDDERPTSTAAGLATRTVEAGEVTVKVEPRQLDDQGAVFAITLDTHSVDLSADLARTATLTVDGVDWHGAKWVGDPPGGHHRDGELSFEPAGPATAEARLAISGLDAPVETAWALNP